MKNKLQYIIIVIFSLLLIGFLIWKFWPKAHEPILKQASFAQLPGWQAADAKKSLAAFQISCRPFLRHDPEKSVGSQFIKLKAKDWIPACKAALSMSADSDKTSRAFFETWFTPVEFYNGKPVKGLFTGYYLPLLNGSLTKTKEFSTPIYGLPTNLITAKLDLFDPKLKYHRNIIGRLKGKTLVPYYTREEIEKGAIKDHARVIAWINNKVDRKFLEIEGSGVVQLQDGTQLYIGYEGENGATYTSIAAVLIKMGVMTKDNASMQAIRNYFKAHPEQVDKVLNQNKSFVFFTTLSKKAALGAQGVPLTPGYSLAVDRKWIPLGVPIWLNTTQPSYTSTKHKAFQRLMVAQDTGGAIRGPVRGDVFWGPGEEAAHVAGHMKNSGFYWLLLPKNTSAKQPD